MVCSAELKDSSRRGKPTVLNLDEVAFTLEETEFNPETFPGVVMKIDEMCGDPPHQLKVAILLFSSGKIVCTGAKSLQDAKDAVGILLERLNGKM